MSNLTHNRSLRGGPFLALGSAFLFVASTPVAKLLLGITDPLLLAGLLYLASGAGLAFVAWAAVCLASEGPRRRCACRPALVNSDRNFRRHSRTGFAIPTCITATGMSTRKRTMAGEL
jgi:hypothetical protein